MKLYDKRRFCAAILLLAFGISGLLTLRQGFSLYTLFVSLLLFGLGVFHAILSFGIGLSRRDKLELLDERNQAISLRTAQTTLRITQLLIFPLLLLLQWTNHPPESTWAPGAGLLFLLAISILVERIAHRYYEKHI